MTETSSIVERSYTPTEKWAFQVCNENKVIKRLENGTRASPMILGLSEAIRKMLGPMYYAVHVRRGDKVRHETKWPHLDEDTRPPKLLTTLLTIVPPNSTIYIATDEREPHFFDALRVAYSVWVADDFKRLWQNGSAWWKQCEEVTTTFEMDAYILGMVDYDILANAHKKVETFNDLTKDGKRG
eukprot:TRINITY_DN5429_c0_g1_i2.p2 TRINITY_DN5429_c0_g1~~TRINITY_DN5429_c0_g1_i2.p2  ORF type:complete len:184 (-),score=23.96 TRINITY_DN5429_c0_g1_i2:787-1338(-)